jgi:hypothetical protein
MSVRVWQRSVRHHVQGLVLIEVWISEELTEVVLPPPVSLKIAILPLAFR